MATVGSERPEEREKEEKKKTVRKLRSTFYDGHGVLRESGGLDTKRKYKNGSYKSKAGRFAKDTTPKHKRPKRIPFEKKEKKAKKR